MRTDIMVNNSEKLRKRENIENNISFYLNSHNPVFILNRKGEFTEVNDAFCKNIGIKSDDILGKNIGDANFITDNSRKKVRVRNVSRLLGKESPYYDIDIITTNGDTKTLKIDTKPIIKQGRIIGEIGIAQKIGENYEYSYKPRSELQIESHYDIRKLQNEIENIRNKLDLRERDLYDVKQELRNSQSMFEKKISDEELEKKQEELESMIREIRNRNNIIDQLQKQLTENQGKVFEKNKMILQLQDETRENVENHVKKEMHKMQEELDENNKQLNILKAELERKEEEIETRGSIIKNISQQLNNNQAQLIKKASTEGELGYQEQQLSDLPSEFYESQKDLEELRGNVKDLNIRLHARENLIEELESELLKLESENERQKDDSIRKELENKLHEIECLNAELKSRNEIINQIKKQLSENQTQLIQKNSLINALKSEGEKTVFGFNNIIDSLSSSIIIMDKDNKIISLNDKARQLFSIDPNRIIGTDIIDLELMKDKQIIDARNRSFNENKPITEKSITLKNQNGDIRLVDISQMTLTNDNGEAQGSIIIIDDISNIAGLQAELERKQEDLDAINNKYQEEYKRLSLIDREIEITNDELHQRKLELEEHKKVTGELKIELDNNKQELKQKDETLNVVRKELEEKTNEINQLKIELENNHNELKEKKEQINRIRTELDKRDDEIELKNKDINIISGELNNIQQQFLKNQEELEELQQSLRIQTDELQQKGEIITIFQSDLKETQQELALFKKKFADKIDENVQMKMKLDRRVEELEIKNEELELISKQFNDKSEYANNLQTEIEKLHGEIESKNSKLLLKAGEIEELNEELKASKSAINWFKVEVEDKQKEIKLKIEEIESNKLKIEDFTRQLSEDQLLLNEKDRAIEKVQAELNFAKEEIKLREQGIETQRAELEKQHTTIQDLQTEVESRTDDLNIRNSKLNSKEQEISKLQGELEGKLRDLENSRLETLNHQEQIKKLKHEKDQIIFHFDKMKNTIPSSVIIVDKDNNIINWNKKAEEMIGLDLDNTIGTNLFNIDIMKKERILEGFRQFAQDKKPVEIKSISVKNKHGNIYLTNISHVPMIDKNGVFQGAIMVLDDISETGEIQSELKRKQEEFEKLDSRFKEVNTKLKIAVDGQIPRVDEEKQREIEHIGSLIENKKKEFESICNSIALKNTELENISKKLDENQSILKSLENDLAIKRGLLESPPTNEENLSRTVKEKLNLFHEIDKTLGLTDDDSLRTKKIPEEFDTEEN